MRGDVDVNCSFLPLVSCHSRVSGGLEENVDEAILQSAFIPFGDIVDVNIPIEQTTRTR